MLHLLLTLIDRAVDINVNLIIRIVINIDIDVDIAVLRIFACRKIFGSKVSNALREHHFMGLVDLAFYEHFLYFVIAKQTLEHAHATN